MAKGTAGKSASGASMSQYDVEVEKIGSFEEALHSFFSSEKPELEKAINETGDWNDDIEKKFTETVEQFKKTQTF